MSEADFDVVSIEDKAKAFAMAQVFTNSTAPADYETIISGGECAAKAIAKSGLHEHHRPFSSWHIQMWLETHSQRFLARRAACEAIAKRQAYHLVFSNEDLNECDFFDQISASDLTEDEMEALVEQASPIDLYADHEADAIYNDLLSFKMNFDAAMEQALSISL